MVLAGGPRTRETVEEWLRFHGCHGALAALHAELGAFEEAQESLAGEPAPSFEWRSRAEKRMLELFDGAHRRLFWAAWEKYVPSAVRETDPSLLRLETDLHSYFVVSALSPAEAARRIAPAHRGRRRRGGDPPRARGPARGGGARGDRGPQGFPGGPGAYTRGEWRVRALLCPRRAWSTLGQCAAQGALSARVAQCPTQQGAHHSLRTRRVQARACLRPAGCLRRWWAHATRCALVLVFRVVR